MRWLAVLFFTFLLWVGFTQFHEWWDGSFSVDQVALADPKNESTINPALEEILDQPYLFLAHGDQTYVFISQDQQYVLKLFKKNFLRRVWTRKIVPLSFPFTSLVCYGGLEKEKRMQRLKKGYETAFQLGRESSALLALHLNQNPLPLTSLTVVDGFGRKSIVPLQQVAFAIQEKGISLRQRLYEAIASKDLLHIQTLLSGVLHFTDQELQQGLYDQDHNIFDNLGFIDEVPVHLDLGKVVYEDRFLDKEERQKELQSLIDKRIIPWLKRHGLSSEISEQIGHSLTL